MEVSKRYLRSRLSRMAAVTEHTDRLSGLFIGHSDAEGNYLGLRPVVDADYCIHGKLTCEEAHDA